MTHKANKIATLEMTITRLVIQHRYCLGVNDYGSKVGEEPIRVSQNWYVWRVNDKDFTRIGKLEGEDRKAEIGIVVNPYDIIERMKTGIYGFVYPDFE